MIRFHELERIHIELSSACNAACPACPRNVDGGYTIPWLKTRTLSFEDFKKIFTREVCQQLKTILMCGNYGDPIYCKDLPQILEYLWEENQHLHVHVHTNGGVRSPAWWSALAKSNPRLLVVFSIDGLEDTNHIYRRNVNWHKLRENIIAYIKVGGHAVWEYLIFKHNQHQIDDARQMAKELGFIDFKAKRAFGFENVANSYNSMRVLDNKGNVDYFIQPPEEEQYRNKNFQTEDTERYDYSANNSLTPNVYKTAWSQRDNNFNYVLDEELKDYEKLDGTEISCMTKNSKEIYIDSNGNVHPCCFLGIGSQNITLSGDTMQYHKWLKENIELDKTNAKNYSLRQILDTNFLSKIENTWNKTHKEGRLMCCTNMCLRNKSATDKLYV